MADLERDGLVDLIGAENFHPTVAAAVARLRHAPSRSARSDEVVGHDVPVGRSGPRSVAWAGPYSVGRATKPVRSPHARAATEVVVVGGDHHRLAGLQAEQGDVAQVGRRQRLVGPRGLGPEDRVPRQPGAARQAHHQRDVAVGVRAPRRSGRAGG